MARRAAELRALGDAKAAAYRARRAGGSADVVVIGEGRRRAGLTEDYLLAALSKPGLPRRSRVRATLELSGPTLLARVEPV